MRKLLALLALSCCVWQSHAQCLIPRSTADTVTPVTNNFIYDTSFYWSAYEPSSWNLARSGNQYFVSGNFTNIGPNHGSGVILDSATKTLTSSMAWQVNGYVRTVIPDGRGGFYIGGDFTQIGPLARNHIAQLNSQGVPTAWNPGADATVNVLVKRNDTLFLGGSFSTVHGGFRQAFAALSLSGDSLLGYRLPYLDTTEYRSTSVYALKLHGTNKLFVGGNQISSAYGASAIEEFDLTTGYITPWKPQYPEYGPITNIDCSADGTLVAFVGTDDGTVSHPAVSSVRLLVSNVATGNQVYRIYFDFVRGGINGGVPYKIKMVGNTLYVAGQFYQLTDASGTITRINGVCAIDITTGLVKNWNLNLNSTYATYVDCFNGKLVVSGPFTKTGNVAREHFLMLDTATLTLDPWNPSPSDDVRAFCYSGGQIYLGGLFSGIHSVHRDGGLAGFDATTGAILPFNPPPNTGVPATTSTKKMVIRGDTLFLLGRTGRKNSSGTDETNLTLYRLSTGQIILSPLAFDGAIHDFFFDNGYMYTADEAVVNRYVLPGLGADGGWTNNFTYGTFPHVPYHLAADANYIYAVGDNRVEPVGSGYLKTFQYATIDKISKTNSHDLTEWHYTDTVSPPTYSPEFSNVVLADSLLFISGAFNSLNGMVAHSMAILNTATGTVRNWSPPIIATPGYYYSQALNAVNKLFLGQSAIWFGFDYSNSDIVPSPYSPSLAFSAIDSVYGRLLPSPVALAGSTIDYGGDNMRQSSPNTPTVDDFSYDPDAVMLAGSFASVDGHTRRNIARLGYGAWTPPTTQGGISGPDSILVALIPDTASYSLSDSLGYTWTYGGSGATFLNTSQNPKSVVFASKATSGILTATGSGYCGATGITAQKAITVVHVLPTPTTSACCMTFTNRQADRMSIHFTPGNGNGRLVVVSTTTPAALPVRATAYPANPQFGSGAGLGKGTFAVSADTTATLTITGLQPSTRYYFTVYEYNGAADSIVYGTAQAYSAYASTLALPPTVAPTQLSFSNVGKTSFTASCTPGNGNARLWLVKANAPISATPVSGTFYYGNTIFPFGSAFGDNSAVAAISGTSVSVSGLTPGTLYYVKVIESSGKFDSLNYGQNAYVMDTVRTLALPPVTTSPTVPASGFTFTGITATSVIIHCVPGDGTRRLFVIQARNALLTTPINGTSYTADTVYGHGSTLVGGIAWVVADSGTTVHVAGLTPATSYLVSVFEYNGTGNGTVYFTGVIPEAPFTTLAANSTTGTGTGVNWADSAFVVRASPNPVQQSLFIQVQANEPATIAMQVVEFSGKAVSSYSFSVVPGPNSYELKNFAHLPRGMYILYLQIGNHKEVIKIFKE